MPEALFSNVFRSPFVDVLRLFAAEDWAHAELRGDVQQAIDKEIGKRTFVMRGKTAAANFLALPRAGAPPLGLDGKFMYIQLRLTGQPFVLHVDVMNKARCAAGVVVAAYAAGTDAWACRAQVRGPALVQ